MDAFMEALGNILGAVDDFMWGIPMIVLLLGSHLFLTIRTKFIQRKIPLGIKMSMSKEPGAKGDVSQFGALVTGLSSTIGTGNIVGVGTAILAGGPGAVLWMWLTGVFGIATKYAETFMSVKYRVRDHKGDMLGGAMYAWERAFKRTDGSIPGWAKFGAGAFALFCLFAALGIGGATQSSAITGVVTTNIPAIPNWAVGLFVVVAMAVVIFGGVRWLSRVCEKLIPFMAVAYIVCSIVILCINWQYVLPALQLIITDSFTPEAAFGGAVGSGIAAAIQFGCARGLFSNESGMGSSPVVAAAATTKNPARQALISMTGTFWDTVVICLLTGLVLTSTIIANPEILTADNISAGGALTSAAFGAIPVIGKPILVVAMILFGYTTILGWSYYGDRCATYLFGKKAIVPFKVIQCLFAFLGAIGIGGMAWTFADIANAAMVIPNIICVLLLSGMIAKETQHYVYDKNLDEVYDPQIPVYEEK